ncbi:MAG: aminopeptidase N [Halofilum sp. (in: g-proteobacteria)]
MMLDPAAAPQSVRLVDYTPPAFRIDSVDLRFELDPAATRVTARLAVQRATDDPEAPLVLDGEHLTLISVAIAGNELSTDAYRIHERSLTLPEVPDRFELTVVTEISPEANTALEGLYISSGNFCTQCEAEGFRRITYFLDRPDVMARYSTTLVAERARYPVLLSNGNPADSGELDDGRHWVRWEDPFPKPCYLFALVAGHLACHEDSFTTASGREVALRIYTEPHNTGKTDHAMRSLKNAMRWDEEIFGLEYDLDLFQIVSVDDFNMGAMENKGLNVFNSKLVLANAETATDSDFQAIEGVIAHEYFHNWTGNRVTCRDWFQLSLKEGLTVFRDQQFSADMGSAPVKRIEDVRLLRTRQFPEDAGPMAHPIRPASYIKIDNFYTLTVYEKGAEVIRMLHTLLGAVSFRRGMDLYFQRHDGQAATCDDFVAAMADANDYPLDRFKRWYAQAGTPRLTVEEAWDPDEREYYLTVRQHTPPTPDGVDKQPVVIPLRMGLLDRQGEAIPLKLTERGSSSGVEECVIEVTEAEQTFVFEDVDERPIASLLRGFSAPVILERAIEDETLRFQLGRDRDAFNRWDAGQTLVRRRVLAGVEALRAGQALDLPAADIDAFRRMLADPDIDDALKAEALTLPSEEAIGEELDTVEPGLLHESRERVSGQLAEALESDLRTAWAARHDTGTGEYRIDAATIGRRRLKNVCLAYLGGLEGDEYVRHAVDQVEAGHNMTDVVAGLRVLSHLERPERQRAFDGFYERWQGDPLVTDKWLTLQATARRKNVVAEVQRLMGHSAFDRKNPNRIRALIGAFAMGNFPAFHSADGSGYRLLADFVIELDPRNPMIASRLIQAMIRWHRFDAARQTLMTRELQRVLDSDTCSDNTYEVVARALGLQSG